MSDFHPSIPVGTLPAEDYEKLMVPMVFVPLAEALVGRSGLRAGERVLDVGCGTGVVARRVAVLVGPMNVAGLDLDPAVLEVGRRIEPHIDWRAGSAEVLPFPDASFDVVLSQMAIQFFPDRLGALREMRRVLAPGGRVAIGVFGPLERSPGYLAVAGALSRRLGPEAGRLGPFALADTTVLRSLLVEASFQSVDVTATYPTLKAASTREFVQRLAQGAATIRMIFAKLSEADRDDLVREVDHELGAWIDASGLAFPVEYNIFTGTP